MSLTQSTPRPPRQKRKMPTALFRKLRILLPALISYFIPNSGPFAFSDLSAFAALRYSFRNTSQRYVATI